MPDHKLDIKPDPDFDRFVKVLRREGLPNRVPFYELFSEHQNKVLAYLGRDDVEEFDCFDDVSPEMEKHVWRQHIDYQYTLGYDYISVNPIDFKFPREPWTPAMTELRERIYVLAGDQTIGSREDFEKYPWPDASKADYSPLERIEEMLPDGMKAIPGWSGVLENAMWLLGYEGISYLLLDDEPLVKDVFDALGSRIAEFLGTAAQYDSVGAVFLGDDMGFKTQTMISPEMMRKYVFPWHKKIVQAVHRAGKPILLHACGNLTEVMDDIIDCGWDAKHSFEDVIEPVWEIKKRYEGRITLLGGFDVDKLSRMTTDEVRAHTRMLIEKCAPGGGWMLGSGNSIADYVPMENLLAILEEGYRAGRY